MNLNIPKEEVLAMRITHPAFRPWIKAAVAKYLADAFGCLDTSAEPQVEVDPTVAEIIVLTSKEITDKPHLDKTAVAQVHALRKAIG